MRENRTKIIATIGPSSEKLSTLFKMAQAGMDVCRLNFSHGTDESFSKMIRNIRFVSQKLKKPVGILQDLAGPKLRVGKLPEEGIELRHGEFVELVIAHSGKVIASSASRPPRHDLSIPISFVELPRAVKKNDPVLLDDGNIELKVLSVDSSKTKIHARVEVGGILKSFKGINVPQTNLKTSPLTQKDLQDIDFGVKHGLDFVALSFVEHERDILKLRSILKQKHSRAKIIAKIERPQALQRLEEIIKAADAVMVARGDLGIEVPAEMVPLYQKKIIHLANRYGKPVIVATQMLASMVTHPKPTRAEISDAANAIFDHADCLMLSNETAVGKYPIKAIKVLSKVSSVVERELAKDPHLIGMKTETDMSLTNATCLSAVKLASDIRAKFLVAITKTGYTAREIAKHRPFTPIIVFTPDETVARQLSLVWDVMDFCVCRINIRNSVPAVKHLLTQRKLVKKGDEIVICNAGFFKDEKFLTTFRF